MPHLVPQPRTTRNLAKTLCGRQLGSRLPGPGDAKPTATRGRNVAARADLICDYYLRLPPDSTTPSNSPPQYVLFAKAACPERHASPEPAAPYRALRPVAAPPLQDRVAASPLRQHASASPSRQYASASPLREPASAHKVQGAAPSQPSLPETLGAIQLIGLASAIGATLGGQAGGDVAKCDRKHAGLCEEIALALPGAILGGLTGLALAGRVLACLMPNVVHLG